MSSTDSKTLFQDPVYIVDGHAMIYRAYHVAEKSNVSGVYIFARMLFSLIEKQLPLYFIVAYDLASSISTRQRIYPGYKKKERDPEVQALFQAQEELVFRLLDALGIRRVSAPQHEADDVIATLAWKTATLGYPVVIVTVDKDFLQCIDWRVDLWNPVSGVRTDCEKFRAKIGLLPRQWVDAQALMGDPSDCVPGVHGVGVKTAAKLLAKYWDIEGVFAHLGELQPLLRQKLEGKLEQVRLARRLVELRRDLLVEPSVERFQISPVAFCATQELFKELGFDRRMSGWLYLLNNKLRSVVETPRKEEG